MGGLTRLMRSMMHNLKSSGQITAFKSALVSTKLDSMILTALRGSRGSMVNGWSDKVDDARFEVYWSNYP